MKTIFVTHKPLGDQLRQKFDDCKVMVWEKGKISREELLKSVKGVEVIVSLLTDKIDKEVFESAGDGLEMICNFAVGFDNVDLVEAEKRGVLVTNTPGVLTESVGEHVIALMLAVMRRVVEGDRYVRRGRFHGWDPDLLVGTGLMGKTMGVVGLGRIGRWTGRIAKALGMRVIYFSHSRDEEFELEHDASFHLLPKLLEMADVVSLNVPLTEETKHMIGSEELSKMKRTAVLINTSRGAIVDEKALIVSLEMHKIAGAGLDVFENEKTVNEKLLRLENVVLTPHIASATIEARLLMTKVLINGLRDGLAGRLPKNIVNEGVWTKKNK